MRRVSAAMALCASPRPGSVGWLCPTPIVSSCAMSTSGYGEGILRIIDPSLRL
jgi:hypothetical protein